jgi:hypothetical protein
MSTLHATKRRFVDQLLVASSLCLAAAARNREPAGR